MRQSGLISVFYFSVFIFCHIYPQTSDTLNSNKSNGWLALPFAGYSPETEWAFGAAGIYYFYSEPDVSERTRLSDLLASGIYTTKNQMTFDLTYDLYFKNFEHRFSGYLAYSNYPLLFSGIGNNTKKENEEHYTSNHIIVESTFLRNFLRENRGGLNAGITYDFRKEKINDEEPGGFIDTSGITGNKGGIISGLGIIINWDTRDNTFSCTQGEYAEFKLNYYGNYLFSDFNFIRMIFDIRKYFSLSVFDTIHVLAAQFAANLNKGEVPFYKLSTFGGSESMRGIFHGRYRDKNSLYLQAEYRFHLFWRIGLAAFAGTGEVAPGVSSFSLSGLKSTYGAGLRFSIIPEEKILARIDFGFSKGESQLYIGFSEAF